MNISDIPVVVPNAKLVTKKTMEVDLMIKYKLSIWGRNFELPLLYECYPDEEVIESQREAFAMFEANSAAVAASLEHVKNYVETDEFARLNGDKIENIFKYVMPRRSLCLTLRSIAMLQSCATISLILSMALQFYLRTDSLKKSDHKI